MILSLDFETFSSTDLRKVGAYRYVRSHDFDVTVLAWAFDDEPVQSLTWPHTGTLPMEVARHIVMGGEIRAWNAMFEYLVLTEYYGVPFPIEQMNCTMERALSFGLPGELGEAGPAMGVQIVKDKSAHQLMMRMGRPREKPPEWHTFDLKKMADLAAYCMRDVEAERALGRVLPPLSDFEKGVSSISARTNLKGVFVDDSAIGMLQVLRETTRKSMWAETRRITNGAVEKVDTEVAKLQAWLKGQGVVLASLDKAGVAEALADKAIAGPARRLLELRQAASKSSLGKLDSMLKVRSLDGRARGLLQYYGASRTGRWAGRLIQVQNYPRPKSGVDIDQILAACQVDTGALGVFFPDPLGALSGCLRGCLTATPGNLLAMIDLSQIEARVLAWLAGQDDILETFRRGEDVYVAAAAQIGSDNRQLGKVLVLAAGFGMGATRFRDTAEDYGVFLGAEEASGALYGWRRANDRIVDFWYAVDEAAREAIRVPGSMHHVRDLSFRVFRKRLYIRKPNGEVLVYHAPRMEAGGIVFDGVDQKTKRWGRQRTYGGKLVENVTQSVARDVMAEAMRRVEHGHGYIPVMSVHDELVYEVTDQSGGEYLQALVDIVPAWAAGLPVASKLNVGFRYGK